MISKSDSKFDSYPNYNDTSKKETCRLPIRTSAEMKSEKHEKPTDVT